MSEPISSESLDVLAEDFLARYRRGERPAISEYVERHPDLASEIGNIFPTLVLMEQAVAPVTSDVGPANLALSSFQCPERLGEYRILREIGRGGMGVVYEAEQESLGRCVALKVFPFHALMDARHLSRFQREARAAAQLHHSHIVPVFGVGQAEGVYFYAMQYIDGQGLDAVLSEVIRCRTTLKKNLSPRSHSDFGGESSEMSDASRKVERAANQDTRTAAETTSYGSEDDDSLWSSDRGTYHRRVARLGEQAAQALAYAHAQGIVHRDIKPSNLILDRFGEIWITDFGLAKFTELDDVTHSRDVVGTLRYMAPEQLHGWADPRTDIHGLGLTLYELLALRPVLDARDRAGLLKQISDTPPTSLRRIEPRVPRDLETIIHKAIAKEPADRYSSATEMAADLRRFLENQPILASRVSAAGRVWRWARPNPLLAAVSALLLLAVAFFVPMQWDANRRLAMELSARNVAEAGEREQLRESLLAQAEAKLQGRRPGQRFAVMETLARAAHIRPGADLRDVATTAMALPDLRQIKQWTIQLHQIEGEKPAFDSAFSRWVVPLRDGGFVLRSATDGSILTGFPADQRGPARGFLFSSDEQLLAVFYRSGAATIWDLQTAKPVAEFVGETGGVDISFDPTQDRLAVTQPGGVLIQAIDGSSAQRLPIDEPVRLVRFDPAGKRVAICRLKSVEVWTVGEPQPLWTVELTTQPWDLEWSNDGRRLAVSTHSDHLIRIIHAQDGGELHVLRGHDDVPSALAFHPDGRWLVSAGWDRTLRVWDTYRGTEVMATSATPYVLQFSSDGTKLGFTPDAETMAIAEWAPDSVFREFAPGSTREAFPHAITATENPQVLVTTGAEGAHLWDTQRGVERRFVPLEAKSWMTPVFERSDSLLLSTGGEGIYRLQLGTNEPPGLIERTIGYQLMSILPDNTAWVVKQYEPARSQLWPHGNRANAVTFAEGHPFTGILISPDRRWAVSNRWPDGDIRVWDAMRAKSDRTLGLGRNADINSTPDGRWLLTGSNVEYRVWSMGTWQPGGAWPAEVPGRANGAIAVSQGGEWIATLHGSSTFSIRDTRNWQENLRLHPPFPFHATVAHLSRDGSRLWMLGYSHRVAEWRLDVLRAELLRSGLSP